MNFVCCFVNKIEIVLFVILVVGLLVLLFGVLLIIKNLVFGYLFWVL